MMQKMACKKVLGLLLLVIATVMIFPLRANATDACDAFIKENKNKLQARYGINIDYDADTNLITISMDVPDVLSDIKKDLKFKLVSVSESNNDKVLTETDPILTSKYKTSNQLTYDHDIVLENIYSGFVTYEFKLVPDGYIDPIFKKACPDAINIEYYVVLSMEIGGRPTYSSIIVEDLLPETTSTSAGDKIDCSKNYGANTFEYNFCDMKAKAAEKGTKTITFTPGSETYSKKYNNASPIGFVCDAFVSTEQTDSHTYLSSNTSYLIGTIVDEIGANEYEYVYHYGGTNEKTNCKTKRVGVSCKTKCEEVVSVEYGAPVASTAGLCFEYTVRVTSRVNCEVESPPPKPIKPDVICTPTPRCVHSWGWINTQAGPNEDFDSCINKCDGGKYTTKCSTKCYQQVYGTSSSKKTGSNPDIDFGAVAEQISNQKHVVETDLDNKGKGSYYCLNGEIKWGPEENIARWYVENSINWRKDYDCVKDSSNGGGIVSICSCSAKCYWTGCKGDVYLNKEEAETDYKKNVETYKELKKKCEAYASCKTTQATFSIDVDYVYGKENKKATIYFPYSNNDPNSKDTIQYGKVTQGSVECTKQEGTTIISSDGCYLCGNLDLSKFGQNMYQTEWGFPGSWIGLKHGELSYEPISGSIFKEHLFCTPQDTNNVNVKWWTYYYARKYGNDNTYSFNDDDYLSKVVSCPAGSTAAGLTCNYSNTEEQFNATNEIDYNIRAHTREFGYFGWNIDISCFYAINKNFPSTDTCGPNCITEGESLAKVRAVDLNNLFPDKTNVSLTDPSQTGRSPGFNWSSHATNTIKDKDYQSRPSSYTKWVQEKGYNVYSEEYLDYEVTLTKSDIKKLKADDHNYTDYQGEFTVDSVVNYRSPLFASGGLLANSKHPNEDALKCNNMKNWQSSECQVFAVGGEEVQ